MKPSKHETLRLSVGSHETITDEGRTPGPRARISGVLGFCAFLLTIIPPFATGRVVAAEKYGGVEIGAKGVKAAAVEVDGSGPEATLKPLSLSKATEDLTLARLKGKKFDKDLIEDVAVVVADFIKELEKLGVPNENIQVVASSGVPWVDNFPDLAGAIRRRTNKRVDKLDATQEAALTAMALVPAERRTGVLIVDIGSGNTKGGTFLEESGSPPRFATLQLRLGTTSLSREIDAKLAETKGSRADVARQVAQQEVGAELRLRLKENPELGRRGEVLMSGGCVWAFLTIMKPETALNPFPEFTPADVKAYVERINAADGKYPEVDFARATDAAAAKAAKADYDRICGTQGSTPIFTPQELQSGAALLEQVSDALSLSERKTYFDRKAVTAWITALITPEAYRDRLPQALNRKFPPTLAPSSAPHRTPPSSGQEVAHVVVDPAPPSQTPRSPAPPPSRGVARRIDDAVAEKAYSDGYELFWSGRYQDALTAFKKALDYSDGDARFWYYKGLAEFALDDKASAEASISQGAKLKRQNRPDSRTVALSLVRVQFEMRRYLNAIADRVREEEAASSPAGSTSAPPSNPTTSAR